MFEIHKCKLLWFTILIFWNFYFYYWPSLVEELEEQLLGHLGLQVAHEQGAIRFGRRRPHRSTTPPRRGRGAAAPTAHARKPPAPRGRRRRVNVSGRRRVRTGCACSEGGGPTGPAVPKSSGAEGATRTLRAVLEDGPEPRVPVGRRPGAPGGLARCPRRPRPRDAGVRRRLPRRQAPGGPSGARSPAAAAQRADRGPGGWGPTRVPKGRHRPARFSPYPRRARRPRLQGPLRPR